MAVRGGLMLTQVLLPFLIAFICATIGAAQLRIARYYADQLAQHQQHILNLNAMALSSAQKASVRQAFEARRSSPPMVVTAGRVNPPLIFDLPLSPPDSTSRGSSADDEVEDILSPARYDRDNCPDCDEIVERTFGGRKVYRYRNCHGEPGCPVHEPEAAPETPEQREERLRLLRVEAERQAAAAADLERQQRLFYRHDLCGTVSDEFLAAMLGLDQVPPPPPGVSRSWRDRNPQLNPNQTDPDDPRRRPR